MPYVRFIQAARLIVVSNNTADNYCCRIQLMHLDETQGIATLYSGTEITPKIDFIELMVNIILDMLSDKSFLRSIGDYTIVTDAQSAILPVSALASVPTSAPVSALTIVQTPAPIEVQTTQNIGMISGNNNTVVNAQTYIERPLLVPKFVFKLDLDTFVTAIHKSKLMVDPNTSVECELYGKLAGTYKRGTIRNITYYISADSQDEAIRILRTEYKTRAEFAKVSKVSIALLDLSFKYIDVVGSEFVLDRLAALKLYKVKITISVESRKLRFVTKTVEKAEPDHVLDPLNLETSVNNEYSNYDYNPVIILSTVCLSGAAADERIIKWILNFIDQGYVRGGREHTLLDTFREEIFAEMKYSYVRASA